MKKFLRMWLAYDHCSSIGSVLGYCPKYVSLEKLLLNLNQSKHCIWIPSSKENEKTRLTGVQLIRTYS
jgi:hypothetical protein